MKNILFRTHISRLDDVIIVYLDTFLSALIELTQTSSKAFMTLFTPIHQGSYSFDFGKSPLLYIIPGPIVAHRI